jgi:hypothetical protein
MRRVSSAMLAARNEAFGQRHFIVAAPDGVLVDVITPRSSPATATRRNSSEPLPLAQWARYRA